MFPMKWPAMHFMSFTLQKTICQRRSEHRDTLSSTPRTRWGVVSWPTAIDLCDDMENQYEFSWSNDTRESERERPRRSCFFEWCTARTPSLSFRLRLQTSHLWSQRGCGKQRKWNKNINIVWSVLHKHWWSINPDESGRRERELWTLLTPAARGHYRRCRSRLDEHFNPCTCCPGPWGWWLWWWWWLWLQRICRTAWLWFARDQLPTLALPACDLPRCDDANNKTVRSPEITFTVLKTKQKNK